MDLENDITDHLSLSYLIFKIIIALGHRNFLWNLEKVELLLVYMCKFQKRTAKNQVDECFEHFFTLSKWKSEVEVE